MVENSDLQIIFRSVLSWFPLVVSGLYIVTDHSLHHQAVFRAGPSSQPCAKTRRAWPHKPARAVGAPGLPSGENRRRCSGEESQERNRKCKIHPEEMLRKIDKTRESFPLSCDETDRLFKRCLMFHRIIVKYKSIITKLTFLPLLN